ncbi:MAG: transaldolase [Microbacteriaceae bacterium]
MSAPEVLKSLTQSGVSLWFDDLSRDRILNGGLAKLIAEREIRGVTTNPSIFAAAISKGDASYSAQMAELAKQGADAEEVIHVLTTEDVRNACDVFSSVYQESNGLDGRVSIEVDPRLAHDEDGTVAQVAVLRKDVDRDNVLIKIPATKAGVGAIRRSIAQGYSINVTLIFSLERYQEVIEAYLSGLEEAQAAGIDLKTIHSVASFFVSRVDSEIDHRLDALGTQEALELRGRAGLANARLAYQLFEEAFASDRAKALLAAGANLQRPLWASTGVKNPNYSDTMYITGLVAANTVNTVPEKTLEATADHGVFEGETIVGSYQQSAKDLAVLGELGISIAEVTQLLEDEGVSKFIEAWGDLITLVAGQVEASR